jgi:Protein of unknown function (DUF2924)
MHLNIENEVAALQRLAVRKLRTRYGEVFGEQTRAGSKAWLIKRIVWRLQSIAEGDLSERARRRAAELANDADVRLSPPKAQPSVGDPCAAEPDKTKDVKGLTPDDVARMERETAALANPNLQNAWYRKSGPVTAVDSFQMGGRS